MERVTVRVRVRVSEPEPYPLTLTLTLSSALPPVPATFSSVGRVVCVAPARAAGVGSVTLSVSDADN